MRITTRPATRASSASPRARSGQWCTVSTASAASKVASRNGSAVAEACTTGALPGRPLGDHRARRLDGDDPTVARLVRAGARADVHHRVGRAERVGDGRRDARDRDDDRRRSPGRSRRRARPSLRTGCRRWRPAPAPGAPRPRAMREVDIVMRSPGGGRRRRSRSTRHAHAGPRIQAHVPEAAQVIGDDVPRRRAVGLADATPSPWPCSVGRDRAGGRPRGRRGCGGPSAAPARSRT